MILEILKYPVVIEILKYLVVVEVLKYLVVVKILKSLVVVETLKYPVVVEIHKSPVVVLIRAVSSSDLAMRSLLPLLPLCCALHRAIPLSPPPSCSTPSHPSPTLSRRHLASSLLTASLASLSVSPASAFFESREQLAVSSVATAQPKVASMLAEVAEVARKRRKMSSDDEDDAYVYRFARGVWRANE